MRDNDPDCFTTYRRLDCGGKLETSETYTFGTLFWRVGHGQIVIGGLYLGGHVPLFDTAKGVAEIQGIESRLFSPLPLTTFNVDGITDE